MDINWAIARKRPILEERARILQSIRAFFVSCGYLEIETPQRVRTNAPEIHIDAVGSDGWFLQTSPELCMKRLLAAGYPRLFQICRVWRQAERGSRHLPEFTMLEWYRAGIDYTGLMRECEELLGALVPSGIVEWKERRIDLSPPWERLTVSEAFARYASIGLEEALGTDRFDEVLSFEVEPNLGLDKPLFLIDYPSSLAALARRKPDDVRVSERFELYAAGVELANAFSELTDPVEQRERFIREEAARRAAGKIPYPPSEKFLSELAFMPEAAGIALGVDRLVMLLTGSETIDEVSAFTPEDL